MVSARWMKRGWLTHVMGWQSTQSPGWMDESRVDEITRDLQGFRVGKVQGMDGCMWAK